MPSVLDGIKVVDLTQMVAGPLCTLLLGDLGADVVKVEPPDGDAARQVGVNRACGESDYFLSLNRNKRSVVLDLKTPEGLETLKALVDEADILVENFRPGIMEKLGIGYDVLSARNPRLIYCGLSGFGLSGVNSERPALDPVIQAMSGLMQLTGTADSGPLKTGILVSDFLPPLFGVMGILSSLLTRHIDGKGQRVDVSMMDASIFSMVPREGYYFSTGKTPGRFGNAHYQISPWNTYSTNDGRHIMIVAHTEKFWRASAQALDPAMLDNPLFATNALRLSNAAELDRAMGAAFALDSLEGWTRRLTEAGALFAPVRDWDEVFSDPAVRESMLEHVAHPTAGEVPVLRNPIKLSRTPSSIRRAPPLLGQHTDEVLAELAATAASSA